MNLKLCIACLLTIFATGINGYTQDISKIIDTSNHPEAFWSLTVLDEDGNTLEAINDNKLIIPASNQKLYTLAAVLDRLGPDYKYATKIYGDGRLENGTWKGNLIIAGSGDPSISGFLYDEDRYYVFNELYNQLKDFGIERIEGEVLANETYFDDQVYPKGWDWYDLTFYYGVEVSALSFNNNAVDIEVFAEGNVGDKPRVTHFPSTYPVQLAKGPLDRLEFPGITIVNNQAIAERYTKYDEDYKRKPGTNVLKLGSMLPQGYYEDEALAITNAGFFFVESFEQYLNEQGIKVNPSEEHRIKDYTPFKELGDFEVLATHYSKPLAELVKWANKESDNFYVEMMLKTLAAEFQEIPGTFDNGIQEVRNFLAEQELDTTLVLMNDGSGLAMGNYTTTSNISRLLSQMKAHASFTEFYNSFPIAGIDGTIAHRFKGTELYTNLRAKTGYVGGVRTLSGYFTTKTGNEIIFSLATNHFVGKVRYVDATHQQIIEALYEKY